MTFIRTRTQSDLLIVNDHATIEVSRTVSDHWDRLEGSIRILVVELWSPIVRQVLLDLTGGARRGASLVKTHVETESIAANNLVNMPSRLAWIDDRIGTLLNEIIRAAKANVR